ncbi:MAG: hypothetical protein ACK52W_03125, partial [Alphaproteobacteria bacterium]
EAEGSKLNYWQLLDADLKAGNITKDQHLLYRGLQEGYLASGLGGIVTGVVSEAARVGAEQLKIKEAQRYLPPSLVSEIEGLVNGKSTPGSTGTPDPGLAAAHAEQNAQKARDQARYAMAGTKSTMLGAVHSVADGSTVQSSKVAFVPVAAAPIAFDFA